MNGEISYTNKKAEVILENYRRLYNEFRPHSSLNYAPPAPMAKVMPLKNRHTLASPTETGSLAS